MKNDIKNNTAVNQIILDLKMQQIVLENANCTNAAQIMGISQRIAQRYLQIEKQQIMNDFLNGKMNVYDTKSISAEQYFTETYNQNK